MSRKRTRGRAKVSAAQRKAVAVLICCITAIIITIIAAWQLPRILGWGSSDSYDPELYPVDTTLGAVLTQTAEASADYVSSSVFIGDEYAQSLQSTNQITINQFAGAAGFKISDLIRTACVNFAEDANTYTVPQAIAMMKPHRVFVMLGSNDVDGSVSLDAFIQDYKQALQSISSAYPYCDIIVGSIPPVAKASENSAEIQLRIDQFNQSLAAMCDSDGYKFLNSAEVLKENNGYAISSYLDAAGGFNAAGANELLNYVRTHVYETEDRRPNTSDVPQRVSSPSSSAATTEATPSPTPKLYSLNYTVEEGRGTLTGNGQSGVSTLTVEAGERETVSVTAVAAEGFSFYKWSDGQTEETRYDVVTQDLSVTAMFNDARVALTLDRDNTTMYLGESISTAATVTLGGSAYDNSNVQWAVNDDLQGNMGTFTYTPTETGNFTIKAGIEINGTYVSQTFTVTVQQPAQTQTATLNITGPASVQVGVSTTLTAMGENLTEPITWSCDQQSFTASGNSVQFTPAAAGTYTIRATSGGVSAQFALTVTDSAAAAPTPAPETTPTPTPVPDNTGGGDITL